MITVQQWIDTLEKGKRKYIYIVKMGWKCSENVVGPFFTVEKCPVKNCHFVVLDGLNDKILVEGKWEEDYLVDNTDCCFEESEAKALAKQYEEKYSWSSSDRKTMGKK